MPSPLSDPEFAKSVAELYTTGLSRQEMADLLECSTAAIGKWIKDPRVQAHARRLTIDRVTRITRKIDAEMESRLANVDRWKLDELLKVRKEYLERTMKAIDGGINLTETTEELTSAMEESPELAEQLRALLAGE